MSISSAMSSATTGLVVSSRAAEVVSSNLANILTPGYARRQLDLQTLGQGLAGVGVIGVTRQSDPLILSDRRQADAEVAFSDTRAQFLGAMERVIGTPDQPSSLSALVSAFEARLTSASGNPESVAHLQDAIGGAGDLINGLNRAAETIGKERTEADTAISDAVARINTLLGQIRDVNASLGSKGRQDHHGASLLDQRQSLVDQLAEFIPVQSVPRENNMIALFTSGGAILLDGTPAELGFTSSNLVAPHMTVENGLLSGLSMNGFDIPGSGPSSPVGGGRLAALFSVRDDLAVTAQSQVDAVARDLVERFQQAGLDPTSAPGTAGLFTDAGSAFAPTDEVGLAGRIAVNGLVDPDQGGATWRLRDGLGAAAPGSPGNGSLIADLVAVLQENRSLASAPPGSPARSAAHHVGAMTTRFGQERLSIDQALSFASARRGELTDLERRDGVDSDAELQTLLLIEQAYAANARMIQTIDEMMQAILRI